MKKTILSYFILFPFFAVAQIYMDASENLPNNGAKGPSMDVRAADLDGDGDLDIILANEFQPNTILINDGNGVFANGTSGNLPQPVRDSEDVTISDFNSDGHLDLVFCSEDDVTLGTQNVHEYYFGNGDGSFISSNINLPDSEANAVISADINGDGFPDLFFGNNGGTGVLINNGDGTFSEENDRVPQLNKTTQDLALADVDGDGDMDLFEGNENGNILHINDGTGNYSDETADRLPSGLNIETRKVTFGDVDGDNDLDIFLSNVEFIPGRIRQNRLFINNGSGIFTDMTTDNLPTDNDHTIDAIFEDVDLDDDLDIVVANVFGGTIKIYTNDGTGVFSNNTQDILGQNYVRDALGVIAEDLNGDGFWDIYICDRFFPQNNGKDLLLLREAPSSDFEEEFVEPNIMVFPNPASSYFLIKTNMDMPERISLFNSSGKIMAELSPKLDGIDTYRFDISHLTIFDGLYFLEIGEWEAQLLIEKNN